MEKRAEEGEAAIILHLARWHFVQAEKKLLRLIERLEVGEAGAPALLAELHRLRAEELEGVAAE